MPPKDAYEYFEGEDLARNRESGIFYAVKHFKGMPPLNKSTGHKDKRLAKKELPRLIREHLERYESGKRAAGESPTVADLISEVERTESPSLRKKTQSKRKFYFKRIREDMELGPLPIDLLTLKVWTSRLERLMAKMDRKTFWDYSKHMNILLRYAYEQKYVTHLTRLPNPDPKKQTGTVLSIEEIRQLWEVMGEDTRDQFVLAYECCMRLREALHLTWDRVDLESGEITLRPIDVKTGSKTGRGRQFYMTENALKRIRARKKDQENNPSKWVFPSPTGRGPIDDNKVAWNRAKKKALEGDKKKGVPPMPNFQHWVRWHDARHSALSHMLLDQKMSPLLVSEYAGVSIHTIQKVYLHSTAEKTREISRAIRITRDDDE